MPNTLTSWVRRLFTTDHPRRERPAFRPTLERLEDRLTPSVTFAGQQTFAVGGEASSVAVGDFNGDGKTDLAVANYNNANPGTVSVLLNNTAAGATTPSFAAAVTFTVGIGSLSVAVGDFNGDGKTDLAVANFTNETVSVLLNTTATGATTPSFATPVTFGSGGMSDSVAVGDFNGDGKPDLAVADAATFSGSVSILLDTTATGATTPSFTPQQSFEAGTAAAAVAVGDFNGDGRPDLAVANFGDNTASVLLDTTTTGATTASFAAQQTFAVGVDPLFVAVGDFNGDGRLDLTVANQSDGTVSVLLDTAAVGAAVPSFSHQVTFAVGGEPESVAVGDFNGDGKPDLAVASKSDGTASVLLDTTAAGATVLAFATQTTFAVGGSPDGVAAGDFNGDGKTDLAVANFSDHTASVLLNTTAPQTVVPSFGGKQTFAAGSLPSSTAAADFNGDGRPDLAVTDSGAGRVAVLLDTTAPGATTPSFAGQTTFAVGSAPHAVALADFNGDGRPDLVVANLNGNTVSVLLNVTPAGATVASFALQTTFAVGHSPTSVVVGDFNGDGRPDLAIANFDDNTVSVLLNTTTAGASVPSFAVQKTFAVGVNPDALAVGDFNGDGKPDLAVANDATAGTVSVLLNKTTAGASVPAFAVQKTFAVGVNPDSVAAGDFNGDGKIDLAVASDAAAGTVSVLLNKTAAGAGVPSFASPITFAAGADPLGVAAGDFNGDGTTDLAVVNPFDGTISVLSDATAGGPPGLFLLGRRTFAVGASPVFVAAADFNGDGRPDFAVANNISGGTVSVLLNTTAPFAVTAPVVVADVHGLGVVEYNRTTGAWVQLNPGNTADVTLLAADALGDVFADYAGYGVFRYTPALGSWQVVNGTDAVAMAVDARGDAFLSFNGAGVGVFRLDGSARLLTPSTATMLAADPSGDLAGEFLGYGVSIYGASSGSWSTLNGNDALALAIDAAGDVFASFNGAGVAEFRLSGGGQLLTPVTASLLAVDAGGDLAGQFAGYGVSRYTPSSGAWTELNGRDAAALAVDAAGDVFASIAGAGVAEFRLLGGGQLLSASAASLLAADPFGGALAPL